MTNTPPSASGVPFHLEEFVSDGRLARVYRARHDTLGVVALKLARESVAAQPPEPLATHELWFHTGSIGRWAPDPAEIIAAEARALDAVQHPAFPRLLASGPAEGGAPAYLATEWIEGANGRAAPERLTLARVAEVARALADVASALAYHGDIKPENLLVDATGRTHILDPSSGAAERDENGELLSMLATPSYNPFLLPSDVPALGLVLAEVLTGRQLLLESRCAVPRPVGPVLERDLGAARGLGHGHAEHLRSLPLPRELNPAIPAELEAIALRCLGLGLQGEVLEWCAPYSSPGAVADALARFSWGPRGGNRRIVGVTASSTSSLRSSTDDP